jgi:hypothetical protein
MVVQIKTFYNQRPTNESELIVFQVGSISKNRLVKKMGKFEQTEPDLAIRTINDS